MPEEVEIVDAATSTSGVTSESQPPSFSQNLGTVSPLEILDLEHE